MHACAQGVYEGTEVDLCSVTWTSCSRYWLSLSSVRPCTRQRRANSLTMGSGKLQSSSSKELSGSMRGQSRRRQYIWGDNVAELHAASHSDKKKRRKFKLRKQMCL